MRNLFILLLCATLTSANGQKLVTKNEGHQKLPMSLMEYYGDSMSVIYSGLSRLSNFAYCNEADQGKPASFSKLQNWLLGVGTVMSNHEGNIGYALLEEGYATPAKEAFNALGMKNISMILSDYEVFVKQNADKIQSGEDETLNTKMWFYDSLLYDAAMSKENRDILFNHIRNSGMFFRYDGKAFDPKAEGMIRINNPKGVRLDEIEIKNGVPTGVQYNSTVSGKPSYEFFIEGDFSINKSYRPDGTLSGIDSTNTKTGATVSRSFYPNGKTNIVYTTNYRYDADNNLIDGMSRELSYFQNGKLACETETDHLGTYKIVQAFDPKGRASVKNGTGKVYREMSEYMGGISLTVTEHKNHIQDGTNETFMNGRVLNSFMIRNGVMQGVQKGYHWKNGKVISESTYDAQGNFISDKNLYAENAPKIDAKAIKISIDSEPDVNCTTYGVWDVKYGAATISNEKQLKTALMANYNLLHYNEDDLTPQEAVSYKYLTVDVDAQGNAINSTYTDKEAEILKLIKFNPAIYDGKPVVSRLNVNITTNW